MHARVELLHDHCGSSMDRNRHMRGESVGRMRAVQQGVVAKIRSHGSSESHLTILNRFARSAPLRAALGFRSLRC